jgi:hypothetical protein
MAKKVGASKPKGRQGALLSNIERTLVELNANLNAYFVEKGFVRETRQTITLKDCSPAEGGVPNNGCMLVLLDGIRAGATVEVTWIKGDRTTFKEPSDLTRPGDFTECRCNPPYERFRVHAKGSRAVVSTLGCEP